MIKVFFNLQPQMEKRPSNFSRANNRKSVIVHKSKEFKDLQSLIRFNRVMLILLIRFNWVMLILFISFNRIMLNLGFISFSQVMLKFPLPYTMISKQCVDLKISNKLYSLAQNRYLTFLISYKSNMNLIKQLFYILIVLVLI
jgi:hypothetical protein